MKKIALTLIILQIVISCIAETGNTGSIKGIVIENKNNEKIQYATVRLFKDSVFMFGTISDEQGRFEIKNIPKGKYLLKINFVGFKTKTIPVQITKKVLNLSNIKLAQNDIKLNEVLVTGDRIDYKSYVNKDVFVPDTLALKGSMNALDVLSKVPSLKVNRINNTVTILGEQNVLILINGMDRQGNENLQTIKPEDINKVEIITNPSAKYDSEYTGVLNIILKKNITQGFTLNTRLGWFGRRHNDSGTKLEFGYKKLRFFVDYNLYYRNHPFTREEKRNTIGNEGTTYIYKSKVITDKPLEFGHYFQYGFDYFINDKNTINFTADYRPVCSNFSSNKIAKNYINENLKNYYTTSLSSEGNYKMQNYSFYYKKQFEKSEQELNIDFNFYKMYFKEKENFTDSFYTDLDDLIRDANRKTDLTNDKKSYNFKINYSQPINKNISFETGYNLYVRNFDDFYNEDNSNENFLFLEYRNAAYLTTFVNFKKYNLQAGLRAENSTIKINDSISDNYTYLSPSIGIMRKINKKNSLRFNYRHRLRRPRFGILDPFTYKSDSMNYSQGNSYIKPAEQDNFEINYTFHKKKIYISPTLYYNQDKNVIGSIVSVNENIKHRKFENIGIGKTIGLKLSSSVTLFKIIKLNPYFSISHQSFEYQQNTNKGYSFTYYLSSEINLPKNIFFGFDLGRSGKQYYLQGYNQNHFSFNSLYVGKSILKNKGFIIAGINYPFNNIINDNIETYINYSTSTQTMREVKFFFIKFSYTFHKGKEIKKLRREYNMERDK